MSSQVDPGVHTQDHGQMDDTLAVAAIGLLGAALGALATYWVQLRADIRAGRAKQTIIQLDLDRAVAAAKARVTSIWNKAEAENIVEAPLGELKRLEDDVNFEGENSASVSPEHWAPLPRLESWDANQDGLAARVDKATIQSIQRAALAIGSYNDAAARYRRKPSRNEPRRSLRRALATTARARTAAEQTARAQRVIDRLPTLVTVLLAGAAVAGILALAGVFQASRPSTTAVASALSAALGADDVVECEPRGDHYRCVAASDACQTAALTPATCPDGTGRSIARYEAFLGEATPAGGVDLLALSGKGPPPSSAGTCPEDDIVTAVSDADLTELERIPLAERPKSLRLVNAIITCLTKLVRKSAATAPITLAARVRTIPTMNRTARNRAASQ